MQTAYHLHDRKKILFNLDDVNQPVLKRASLQSIQARIASSQNLDGCIHRIGRVEYRHEVHLAWYTQSALQKNFTTM